MNISFIPKTIKAIKSMRSTFKKRLQSFLKNSTRRIKLLSKRIDSKTSMKIRSFTKKHSRK
jgi:hypothetical protein